jgi:hypothetical protein
MAVLLLLNYLNFSKRPVFLPPLNSLSCPLSRLRHNQFPNCKELHIFKPFKIFLNTFFSRVLQPRNLCRKCIRNQRKVLLDPIVKKDWILIGVLARSTLIDRWELDNRVSCFLLTLKNILCLLSTLRNVSSLFRNNKYINNNKIRCLNRLMFHTFWLVIRKLMRIRMRIQLITICESGCGSGSSLPH